MVKVPEWSLTVDEHSGFISLYQDGNQIERFPPDQVLERLISYLNLLERANSQTDRGIKLTEDAVAIASKYEAALETSRLEIAALKDQLRLSEAI